MKNAPTRHLNRKEFINQSAAGIAAASVAGSALGASISRPVEASEKVIGIPTGKNTRKGSG